MNSGTGEVMKRIVRTLVILALPVALGLALIASHGVSAQSRTTEPDLTVHEWGTFTSIAGAEGQAVEWQTLTGPWPERKAVASGKAQTVKLSPSADISSLPSFVEHFGWAGFKLGLRGTIRMETPVLYFYAPRD